MGEWDDLLESHADRHQRYVLAHLLNAETGRVRFDELVDNVVEEMTHSPGPDREDVAIILYHWHLPKLAESGLIEYDAEHGIVTTTD